MGEVYRAQDLRLGQAVALKFLPEELEKDESRLMRFLQEVRLSRQISHPNVCRVHDVGEVDGHPFLSMEFVDGEDLASLLRRIGRLPGDKALQIARQLCAGLSAAHREGILHRDLKPANVMIDGKGHVRITDFGLAGLADKIEGAEIRAGTPAYMAPEQVAGEEVTFRSDLYSLGLVLYELFTGKPVYKVGKASELLKLHETPPVSPSLLLQDIDLEVEKVILRCLERDPQRRPESAYAVAAALPGGNPLMEVLAAGDTPSPEMVAASGRKGGLKASHALGSLVIFLLGCLTVNLLMNQVSLWERIPLSKRPEVLEEEARDLLSALGFDTFSHQASQFDVDEDYLQNIEESDDSVDRWDQLRSVYPSPVSFWYRQSPRPLVPNNGVGRVSLDDPPARISGMATVRLGPEGRLYELLAIPPEFDDSIAEPFTGWGELFSRAGLEMSVFSEALPAWNPLVDCDERKAWTGSFSGQETVELRIEAGSYRGRPVYFRIIAPWTTASRMEVEPEDLASRIVSWIGILLLSIVLVGASVLALRNLRLGRGDWKGGLRLAGYVFAVSMLFWVFRIDHVASFQELALLFWSASASLFLACLVWIVYVALEPYVRRIWPETLVTWSRLMAGFFKDPLIGRDILYGGVAGVLVALLFEVALIAPHWLGFPMGAPAYGDLVAFSGMRQALSTFFNLQWGAVVSPLFVILLILVLRVLLRRYWLAVGLVFILFASMQILQTSTSPFSWPFLVLIWVMVIVMVTRFGLLPSILMFYFADILLNFALPSDLSSWYVARFLFFQLLLIGAVVYGFYRALAGQNWLGEDLI